jgi:hypothetical protein
VVPAPPGGTGMVGGFNTNVRYRGRVFHVQTEDSGPMASRMVITLVYEGGVILSSKKTRYDGVADPNERQKLVRELMESQHAEIVRSLKSGELDGEIGLRAGTPRPAATTAPGTAPVRAAEPAIAPAAESFGQGVISDVPLDRVVLSHLGVR